MSDDRGRHQKAKPGIDVKPKADGETVEHAVDDKATGSNQTCPAGTFALLVVVMQEALQGIETEEAHQARTNGQLGREVKSRGAVDRVGQQVEECSSQDHSTRQRR